MFEKILLILFFCVHLGLAPENSFSGAGPRNDGRDSLRIGVGRDFHDGPDSRTFLHGSTNTWEALTYLDEHLRARPWLAESWETDPTGREWIFKLRKGVLFHDGSPMTATDVVANLQRMRTHSRCDPLGIYKNVDRIQAIADDRISISLKEPATHLPNLLAYYSSPVLKPTSFDKDGRISGLIGTGPYQVASIQKGQFIELGRFDHYWGKKPAFRKVIFKTILDAQTRVMALATAEIDAIADVGSVLPEQADEVRAMPNIVLKQQEVATTHYLLFNAGSPMFAGADARLWAASLINRQELLQMFVGEAGKIANSYYTPLAADWSEPCLRTLPGKKPVPAGQRLRILLNAATIQRWPYLEIVQVLQSQLLAEGFPSEILVQESGAWRKTLESGDWEMTLQPNTLMTGDPDFFFSYYLLSDSPGKLGYHDEETDKFIIAARLETDFNNRRNLYQQICKQLNRDLPIFPLYHDLSLYAHRKDLENFILDQNFRVSLENVRLP